MADVKELNINNTTYTIKDAVARSGLTAKQNTLVSGTNIKTINGQSVLGSGDLQTPYRNIGEIVVSTLPLTDAGLHLLDGSLILGGGIYSAFVTYISGLVSTYPDLFTTEADWQTSVSTYGVCGKFVYTNKISATMQPLGTLTGTRNSSSDMDAGSLGMRYAWYVPELSGDIFTVSETPNVGDAIWVYQSGSWTTSGVNIEAVSRTVRLPKVTGILEGTTDVTALGDLVEAGLPNITGTFKGAGAMNLSTGAFNVTSVTNTLVPGNGALISSESFDASRSSSIYGNSSTVQPQTIKCYYYIVIATSTKTDIQVDIDEVVTDLNGKADVDLTNVSNTSGFRRLIEVSDISILPSWYKVFAEYDTTTGDFIGNWCEQGGFVGNITPSSWVFVNLLKPYKANNYNVIGSGVDPSVSTSYPDQFFAYRSPLQTTGFYGGVRYLSGPGTYADRGFSWKAEGYIN